MTTDPILDEYVEGAGNPARVVPSSPKRERTGTKASSGSMPAPVEPAPSACPHDAEAGVERP